MPRETQSIDIGSLDIKELAALRDNLDAEVQNLTQSALALQRAAGDFGKSGQAIERLADQKDGQPMLVPVTGSLYVQGEVVDPQKVLVDIGTGYYMENTTEQGASYCRRKVQFLRDQIQQVLKELKGKQQVLAKITSTLRQKTQAA